LDRAPGFFGAKLWAALAGHHADAVTLLPIFAIPHFGAPGAIKSPCVEALGNRIF